MKERVKKLNNIEIKIIGLGGIGSVLCENIARFMNYEGSMQTNMILIDGDKYERKNLERQVFGNLGNKAEVKIQDLASKFRNVSFEAVDSYINSENIHKVIREGDCVFLCVDNHKTRKVVSEYCETLNDVTLISGGNDLTDGNTQLYYRKGGEDITPSLTAYHSEIQDPQDKSPDEMSCEELEASSTPQLFFVNSAAALNMCFMFYNAVIKGQYKYSEVYFDMTSMCADSKIRATK